MNLKFLKPSRIIKSTAKTVADVPGWLGLNFLKDNTVGLIKFIKPIYSSVHEEKKETFEQAMQRLGLTEDDLKARMTNLRTQSWVFAVLAIAVFIYAVYLITGLHILATLIALLVSGLFIVKMCHCRLWMFQINHRKLGCSFGEWLHNKVKEPKS